MFCNICNQTKNVCLYKKNKIQPLLVNPLLVNPIRDNTILEKVNTTKLPIKNKLITCYEEDYTRNSNDIMRLWQRN